MTKKKILTKTTQCSKCPWRKNVDVFSIPDGYNTEAHLNLACTIADPNNWEFELTSAMSCHEHSLEEEIFCVGWLHNQLGVGNNIALRIEMRKYSNAKDIQVIGEQHQTFADTLPEGVEFE